MVIWVVTSSILSAIIAGGSGYLLTRKLSQAKLAVQIEQANAKAKAIEYEHQKNADTKKSGGKLETTNLTA